ncbi:MAG: hypothetical protein ACJA08_000214 [Cyclobacteriaceae bacterium]|jgi:hypothetical protein
MNNVICFGFIAMVLLLGCTSGNQNEIGDKLVNGAIKVEVRQENGKYQLYRGGSPYAIKGAGLIGDFQSFKSHGGNSIRTWSTDNAQELLDQAYENNVTVALCFYIKPERHGMDYDDMAAVQDQFEQVKKEVIQFKDHPALLMWVIGNELNYSYTNSKVYDAVNDISIMIHELDPNHPTTTTITVLDKKLAEDLKSRAPDIDILSMQLYGSIYNLPKYVKDADWTGPYLVTEWGAIGHWEMQKTTWGAPFEQNSTQKAQNYLRGYKEIIQPYADQCIGNYVFLWGQKQERTPTWYGMFLPSNEETEPVDVMHYIWNGEWPENRTPRLDSVRLDGKFAVDNIYLEPGQEYKAEVYLFEYDSDSLTFRWEIMHESKETKEGGDHEEVPERLDLAVKNPTEKQITLMTPDTEGAYRLFVYAYDLNGHAAHANIPFYVKL